MSTKNTTVNKGLMVFGFLVLLVFCSCRKSYAPAEYKQWIESEESGLHKMKTIGQLTYQVMFQTPEYLVLLNQGPEGMATCDIEKETAAYQDGFHFLFTISSGSGEFPLKFQLSSEAQFYARQEYLNSAVVNDFFLVTAAKDTIDCRYAHAERDFGISPDLNIDLVFEKPSASDEFKFCYNDRLFDNGMIKFSFPENAMTDLPYLLNK